MWVCRGRSMSLIVFSMDPSHCFIIETPIFCLRHSNSCRSSRVVYYCLNMISQRKGNHLSWWADPTPSRSLNYSQLSQFCVEINKRTYCATELGPQSGREYAQNQQLLHHCVGVYNMFFNQVTPRYGVL